MVSISMEGGEAMLGSLLPIGHFIGAFFLIVELRRAVGLRPGS